MAAWSQSPFLQALGWAMLNSFWQMALLYASLMLLQQLFRFSSHKQYYFAIGSLGVGFAWFIYTLQVCFENGVSNTILSQHPLAPTSQTWNVVLSSVSLAYLFLLLVPAYRLVKNWRYIEYLKKFGLQKTAMEYRLFVKKTAQRLGIKHTVHVYLSQLVHSPVTIGFLKPIILLPLAAMNNLSQQQAEAVLLHELSHIKRYDYVINFIIKLLQTLFYFNPFVKRFVSLIEFEREKCCDELVLQFEYDKVSYAAALLSLEKNLLASEALILAAAGKNHLLRRIEKILDLSKKDFFSFQQFAGVVASILVIFFTNSLLFVDKEVKLTGSHSFTAFENPLYQFEKPVASESFSKAHISSTSAPVASKSLMRSSAKLPQKQSNTFQILSPPPAEPNIIPVAFDVTDASVTPEEKAHVTQTIETTKKILEKSKWKEVEVTIGDGMTAREKSVAELAYLKEINNLDWKTLENRLKSEYSKLDWPAITAKLDGALVELKLDSLQTNYQHILIQINKSASKAKSNKQATLPIPDVSVQTMNLIRNELKVKVDSITVLKTRKVINF